MKNLNVTKEVVERFAEAAETIIVAKSKLSRELTGFIEEQQFKIEADAREQNPCAVGNLMVAIERVEVHQSKLDRLVVISSNKDGGYKITIPNTNARLLRLNILAAPSGGFLRNTSRIFIWLEFCSLNIW